MGGPLLDQSTSLSGLRHDSLLEETNDEEFCVKRSAAGVVSRQDLAAKSEMSAKEDIRDGVR
jgi:hypothetical protein